MLYYILRYMVKMAVGAYFRRIAISGKKNMPKNEPVVFIVNHPSALIDPLVPATYLRKVFYYLAADEYFGKGLQNWFMQKQINMIPVYRPNLSKGEKNTNDEMFARCYDHLAENRAIMVFPEGTSETVLRARPLKTGTARVVLGAEKKHGIRVKIVPIGLNYTNPHRFQSDVYMNIGEAITSEGITGDEKEQVHELTERMHEGMKSTLLHTKTDTIVNTFNLVDRVYRGDLEKALELRKSDAQMRFALQKQMIAAIDYFHENRPEELKQLTEKADQYLETLKRFNLSNRVMANPNLSIWQGIKLLIGLPLFVVGMLVNLLPYFVVKRIYATLKVGEAFKGSIAMMIGMVLYLIWFGILAATSSIWLTWWQGLLVFVGGYVSGIFALRYLSWFVVARRKWKVKRLKLMHKSTYEDLIAQRTIIVTQMDQLRQEYTQS